MLKIDWTHRTIACPSLGNILAHATASEYIYSQLGANICVQVPEYYSDLWKLYMPLERINVECSRVFTVKADERYVAANDLAWLDSFICLAGYYFSSPINPRRCFISNRESKQVLLYPREYDNKNRYFTLEYWIEACALIRESGYTVGVILDNSISHRDGSVSVEWAESFIEKIKPDKVYKNDLYGLQAAIVESSIAIGRGNGPSFLMLKSDIRQIVLDSEDEHLPIYCAKRTFSKVQKCVKVFHGNSLEWISEL